MGVRCNRAVGRPGAAWTWPLAAIAAASCDAQPNPNPPPAPGDWIVGGNPAAVYVISESGGVRSFVSGTDLSGIPAGVPVSIRGTGLPSPTLYARMNGAISASGRLLTREGAVNSERLVETDLFTGQRYVSSLTPGAQTTPALGPVGPFIFLDERRIISVSGPIPPLVFGVYEYDPLTASRKIVSSETVGDGPLPDRAGGAAMLDERTLVFTDQGWNGNGIGLYAVDLLTGDRRLLSRLSRGALVRPVVEGGVLTPGVTIAPTAGWSGGEGPVGWMAVGVTTVDGQVYVGVTESVGPGGILRVDPDTGDRELVVGAARDDASGAIITRHPSNGVAPPLGDPDCFVVEPSGKLVFAQCFGLPVIYRLDLQTRRLDVLADLRALGLMVVNIRALVKYHGPSCLNPADMTATAIAGTPGYGEPDGAVNLDDFAYFIAQFGAGAARADLTTGSIDGVATYGRPDGLVNNDDFFYFLTVFSYGC